MKIKRSKGEIVFQVFNYCFLAALTLVCLYPMWHVLVASFMDSNALYSHTGLLIWPTQFSFDAYTRILEYAPLWDGLAVTLKLELIGVSWQMLCTVICAYVLSKRDLLFQRPITMFIMFTMWFSGGMIPAYLNLKDFGLNDNFWGLIFPFSMSVYNMIIMRTAIESLPGSLLEAASLDGAGHLRALLSIVLPLTKATLAVLVLYYGVAHWNNWFWASRILSSGEQPLAVVLRQILIENDTGEMSAGLVSTEALKYAVIVVSTIPILCVYPFIQKHFTKGVMIGAVKA